MGNILVCDDERSICTMLEIALRHDGHHVETVTSGEQAIHKLESALYDVLITDVRMPGISGLEVLRHARRVSPETRVIVITAVDDNETSIQAQNAGALYVRKLGANLPTDVRAAVQAAMENQSLRQQNAVLKRDAAAHNSLDNIIGESIVMVDLKRLIRTVATTNSTVIVTGESGTGKELVARAVHACSQRSAEPFVSINCGAFPETLLESELFGYVKGAFTGANQNKRGLFELANTGTIFLDEISEMSLAMQVKLLRVLQERSVRPVGGGSESPIDVRVIAATNKDLDALVGEGQFREDLYYRLRVIPIDVPPLRERGADVVLLANYFLRKFAHQMDKKVSEISPEALDLLRGYDWPGNVRVLENTIERAVAMAVGDPLQIELPHERSKARAAAAAASAGGGGAPGVALPADGMDMERYIADVERSLLQSALRRSQGVQTRAAEMLKLSYRSFRHMMKKYDL
ncbi:MAG: sigma-54 dependent transcriptional regulator [Candidatus Korobacteraceae bacterium]|jgi:two-component system response regulator PilR (NtrC family)